MTGQRLRRLAARQYAIMGGIQCIRHMAAVSQGGYIAHWIAVWRVIPRGALRLAGRNHATPVLLPVGFPTVRWRTPDSKRDQAILSVNRTAIGVKGC